MSPVVLFLGLTFSVVAGIAAFLIDYEEQLQHYQGRRMPRRVALATSLIAFSVFAILTVLLAWALPVVAK